jgi:ABC-type antimicrobial peptide transport system permease subunit
MRLYDPENRPRPWMTIIGVAPNIRQRDPSRSDDPVIFVPYPFESSSSMALLMRTRGATSALAPALRREVQQVDQDLPLFDTMSLTAFFERQRWYLRVFGTLFLIFATVAMGMAAVGIYGVMSYAASRRTREIGVRMALGAGVASILRLVLGRGVTQLALGLVLGLAAAFGVTRLMRVFLYVSPTDPITFIAVPVVLCAAGLAATWFPARRAARLDPVRALRHE